MTKTAAPTTTPAATTQNSGELVAETLATQDTGTTSVDQQRPDVDAHWAAHRADLERRRTQIGRDARAVFRAMEGWDTHGRLEEDWVKTCQRSHEEYDSGRFLIERLGAERFMDPALMATIW